MHGYTEDQLVEQPAIDPFGKLGWQTRLACRDLLLPRLLSGQVELKTN
jgi:hypothetical protein